MFDMNDLATLDDRYFCILYKDPYDVTIRSKNTGHYWSLHSPDCPDRGVVVIFHAHHIGPFHTHGRANSLRQAVRSIKSHDRWQLQGRPKRR
ncbi:MAG: hypothetical protein K5739_08160 [Lachnospiraceae bacterium]|nr:hypothetical protein [Lachnospiraceae bacterium]